jgi:hypothetical protein
MLCSAAHLPQTRRLYAQLIGLALPQCSSNEGHSHGTSYHPLDLMESVLGHNTCSQNHRRTKLWGIASKLHKCQEATI